MCANLNNSLLTENMNTLEVCHCRSLDDFPDAILGHILSFLPTELAVTTSVLSKRWRYMWTSLTSLDFHERKKCYRQVNKSRERKNFIDFVDRVLCFNDAPPIKRFILSCGVKDDVSRINKWIFTAANRNAREFDITLYSMCVNDPNVLPHCLFSCETLEVLKIHTCFALRLPSRICLPNLKKLTLKGITFRDYHELNLVSSALEELVIDDCIEEGVPDQLIVSASKLLPNLKKLTLKYITYMNYHDLNLLFAGLALEELVMDNCIEEEGAPSQLIISAPKLRSLTIDEGEVGYLIELASSVTISAPLRTFYYTGAIVKEYQLSCSSSIERATLLFDRSTDVHDDPFFYFHNFLRSLLFTKYLRLSAGSFEGLDFGTVPIFENLISLEVDEDPDLNCNFDCSYEGLGEFLVRCPHLETLKIPGGMIEECNINCLLRTECICLSSLKNITIGFNQGNIEELVALHILLAKATSLETMEIGLPSWIMDDVAEIKRTRTFLSNIPRGSKSCQLYFKLLC